MFCFLVKITAVLLHVWFVFQCDRCSLQEDEKSARHSAAPRYCSFRFRVVSSYTSCSHVLRRSMTVIHFVRTVDWLRFNWTKFSSLLCRVFFLKIAVQRYECAYRSFHYDLYTKSFLSARIVNIWNSLPNSVVDSCTVNAFKARLDKFWQHQLVKFDFTADLTGTGNRSEEVMKRYCLFVIV